jgi:hypothetical protein
MPWRRGHVESGAETARGWVRTINAVRDPLQTGQPEYHVLRIFPPWASLSILVVLVVGCPVKPKSPYPRSARRTYTGMAVVHRKIPARIGKAAGEGGGHTINKEHDDVRFFAHRTPCGEGEHRQYQVQHHSSGWGG